MQNEGLVIFGIVIGVVIACAGSFVVWDCWYVIHNIIQYNYNVACTVSSLLFCIILTVRYGLTVCMCVYRYKPMKRRRAGEVVVNKWDKVPEQKPIRIYENCVMPSTVKTDQLNRNEIKINEEVHQSQATDDEFTKV